MDSFYAELIRFLNQTKNNDLKTKSYIKTYKSLKTEVSFGQGRIAKIPWIAFLGENQKVSDGFYPVYLYYKETKILILAYGVSVTVHPKMSWKIADKKTIGNYFTENGIDEAGKYNSSYIYKVYNNVDELSKNEIDTDLNRLIDYYINYINYSNITPMEVLGQEKPKNKAIIKRGLVESFTNDISDSGLIFDDDIITRFVVSMITKPFVILSGLSGSGKTQLALSFAQWISENRDQYCLVPVGADWTNREYLLGYPNALDENKYIKPENGALDLMLRAKQNPDKPYFLILDEMNLSYVERYFADFLSAMESGEPIPLWNNSKDVPSEIEKLPNLYIVGTINVDETTYMFSPKVLDRANVIEFRIRESDMEMYLGERKVIDKSKLLNRGSSLASFFMKVSTEPANITNDNDFFKRVLMQFFKELKKINAEFGYRTINEIYRFVSLSKLLTKMDDNQIIDAAIMQKLLPKLHGSRKKIEPILKTLWTFCCNNDYTEDLEVIELMTDNDNYIYPNSADKIFRMYKCAIDNGFTSFAEA